MIYNMSLFKDFSREIVMLFVAVGGYLIMANINNYLDKLEEGMEKDDADASNQDTKTEKTGKMKKD